MMGEMKPCPFCGSELYIRSGVNPYGHCRTDGCHANRAQVVCLDDPVQVAAWNRRTPPTTQGGEGEVRAIVCEIIARGAYPQDEPAGPVIDGFVSRILSAAPPAPASDHVGEGFVEITPENIAAADLAAQPYRDGYAAGYEMRDQEFQNAIPPDHAALVGEADVPRDEQGRSALEIIRDHNRAHPQRTPGAKAIGMHPPRDPRAPLLGPPSDMLVSKVLLDRLPDMGPAEADTLAVAINDALAAALHPSAEGGEYSSCIAERAAAEESCPASVEPSAVRGFELFEEIGHGIAELEARDHYAGLAECADNLHRLLAKVGQLRVIYAALSAATQKGDA